MGVDGSMGNDALLEEEIMERWGNSSVIRQIGNKSQADIGRRYYRE